MASRRSFTPALCALRQAARQSGAAGLRTLSSFAARPARQSIVAAPRRAAAATSLPPAARRHYSQQPAENKVWSFEEVRRVTTRKGGRSQTDL